MLAANFAGVLAKGAQAELVVPEPPGKKLGWAIVGLGSLAINQILPAFAKCEKSKVVALVSGHPDKAHKLALRYGVSAKSIYNYENYDSIKDNPDALVLIGQRLVSSCNIDNREPAVSQADTGSTIEAVVIRPAMAY